MSEYFDNKNLFMSPKTTQHGSHMIMTDVSKQTKQKYINIDTRFRDEYNYLNSSTTPINRGYNTVANYNITLPDKYNDVKTLSVTNIEIPVTYYNISANLGNNYFKITNKTTSAIKMVTISDGSYTAATLQTAINNALTGLGSPYTSLSITLNQNGISTFILSNVGPPPSLLLDFDTDANGGFDKFNLKFKLGWLLGFRTPSFTIAPLGTAISESLLDLNGPRYLYLIVDEFSNGNQNSFVSPLSNSIVKKNIIGRISTYPSNFSFGSVITANFFNGLLTSDLRSYTGKIDIQRLNVQLVNENGVPMNLNGMDFSFCLRLEHE